tara:strand:- start:2259 stop:3905 length:1647 start_codon:yes stop_codon:yes gene_type:complete
MPEFLGFQINRISKSEKQANTDNRSFTNPPTDDGAVNISATGGSYGQYVDLEGTAKNEAELVTRYRKMAQGPEVEVAVDDIVNEAIVNDPVEYVVDINLDKTNLSEPIKKKVHAEFERVYQLLNMAEGSYDIFKRWYVDGRLYYHAIVDPAAEAKGIEELRYVDPRKIRKVREVKQEKVGGAIVQKTVREFFVYKQRGFSKSASAVPDPLPVGNVGTRIAKDSIVHITSGLTDENNKMVLGYLHKAIKPLNQLQILEDASVIYRISRAPERRIFYIDVGNLPKMKAEQYLSDMMTKHKNRLVYDASDGSVRDDRKFMTMLEDFWLPRREGGRGTEISTLPGGQNLGEMEDVEYFQKKLYSSLHVPASRLQPEGGFQLGRASEISRDELKFSKFIRRLRLRFSQLFDRCMEKQVVLKNIMSIEEWRGLRNKIKYDFVEDNHFTELKNSEVTRERLNTLDQITPHVGTYFSLEWVQRNVLLLNDEQITVMNAQMEEEKAAGKHDGLLNAPGEAPEQGVHPEPEEPGNQSLDTAPGNAQAAPAVATDTNGR